MTESDFQTEVLTTLRKLEAGQAKLSRELCEFREDMGERLGNQWQVNQNIEKHLRTLTGDARLAVLATSSRAGARSSASARQASR